MDVEKTPTWTPYGVIFLTNKCHSWLILRGIKMRKWLQDISQKICELLPLKLCGVRKECFKTSYPSGFYLHKWQKNGLTFVHNKLIIINGFTNGEPTPKREVLFDNLICLNTKEVAAYLVAVPKIGNCFHQGRVQAYGHLGKSLWFKKCDLDALIKGGH